MNIAHLIRSTRGKFFTVDFVKKNGEHRHMVARIGVAKHITGEGLKFNPASRNLMVAWDTVKKEYRMIPLDRVLSFKCGNVRA